MVNTVFAAVVVGVLYLAMVAVTMVVMAVVRIEITQRTGRRR